MLTFISTSVTKMLVSDIIYAGSKIDMGQTQK